MSEFRRHPFSRALIALWSCWFALLLSESAMLHACPMHDGIAAEAMAADGHGGHHASSGQDGEQPATHSCSCIGHCSASSPLAPSTAGSLSWLAGVIDIAPEVAMAQQLVPVEPDYLLPFANGPPLSPRA